MYNTQTNHSNRNEIMKMYQTHLKNLMDLEDGEHEIRKKKLQGGFLPMLLPILGSLFSGKGHDQEAMDNEGYARNEGVVNVLKKRGRGRPQKVAIAHPLNGQGVVGGNMEGKGFISNLGIPGISQLAGVFGLGKKNGKKEKPAVMATTKPKKTSAWIEFVKNYAKQKNIPYKQALSEAGTHYKK